MVTTYRDPIPERFTTERSVTRVSAVEHDTEEVNDIERRYATEIERTDRHIYRVWIWLVGIKQN